VVVFAGMPNGLPAATWDGVSRYLEQGGRLLVAVDPPVEAGVAQFLARFGITTGQGVIVETSGAGRAIGAGPENPVSSEYRDHPVTRGFDERIILGRAVPLGTAPTEIGRPVALALTAATAFERADLVSQATEPREGRDRRGPFALAVATSIARGSRDAALPDPRLIVTGDSDFLANGLITWRANREFAVRMVAWLTGEEEARVVAAGERQNRRVPLTERRAAWMYVVNLGVLPLLPPAAGLIAIWLRASAGRKSRSRAGSAPGPAR
jgi:ABC-type uncharacterized transport system involved in gliding motility auxiliary subunit